LIFVQIASCRDLRYDDAMLLVHQAYILPRIWLIAVLLVLLVLGVGCSRKTTNPPTLPQKIAVPTKVEGDDRRQETIPTKAERGLFLPLQQNLVLIQATPRALSSTPTITPAPPTATPFPPGPASKLGVFVGRNDPQLFTLLQTGNLAVVKTLEYDPNFVTEIKENEPYVFLVARYTPLPQPDFSITDPIAAARAFSELILPIATEPRRLAAIDCWEAYNEPQVTDEAQMASLAAFEAERVRLLAKAGVKSCIGNFGVGQPSLELWPAFYPALEAAKTYGGYLALHEYSAPYLWFGSGTSQNQPGADEGDEGWLTLRYRKVYRDYLQPADLAIPLVITEAGIDGLVGNRPGPQAARGWQDFADYWQEQGAVDTSVFGFYLEQLAWYDAQLAQDDYVIGAAIFALAAPQGWPSYEIGGDWLAIFEQYLSVHPPR